ncbi:MAG: LSm family protein [Nitrososphaeria archaeon]
MSEVDVTLNVLQNSIGRTVLIKLKGGLVIRGTLRGYDHHMNLLLEGSEEIGDGGALTKLGVIVIRGDNVVLISPPSD